MNQSKFSKFFFLCILWVFSSVSSAGAAIPVKINIKPGDLGPPITDTQILHRPPELLQMYRDSHGQLSVLQGKERPNYNRTEYSIISSQPTVRWFSDWNPNSIRSEVASYVGEAAALGQVPIMAIYNIYKRDCTSASNGGAQPSDAPNSNANEDKALANYKKYITNFMKGIRDGLEVSISPDAPVIIILEPDSLGLQSYATVDGVTQKGDQGCADFSAQYSDPKAAATPVVFTNSKRNQTLGWAVNKLSSAACYSGSSCPSYQSRVKVYLDGTHSGWGAWPSVADGWLVQALIDAGIQDAAGIFTNASNYEILGDPNSSDPHNGEVPYGKWLLDKVKTKLGGTWGTYNCGSTVCSIPEKRQVIDVARTGAGMNLSNSNDQGNGWSAWCDNAKALVGPIPTLHPNIASWVDALLWIKPAGETDGCFGNGKTNHSIARGVPNPDDAGTVRAGTFSFDLSCMLLNGSSGFDDAGNPILNDCEPIKDVDAKVPRPHKLRIAAVDNKSLFPNSADGLLLEWEPSPGACSYQVLSRVGNSGSFYNVLRTYGDDTNGPATSVVVTPQIAGKAWRTGETVQYTVRARNCGVDPVWSNLSNAVTTHNFP